MYSHNNVIEMWLSLLCTWRKSCNACQDFVRQSQPFSDIHLKTACISGKSDPAHCPTMKRLHSAYRVSHEGHV